MANNFNIPSCQAVWNFEPGAMLVDSMGKQIDLTAYSPGSPSADATCKEGATSALFTRSAGQHLYALDEDLPAGFPLKSDYASKLMTICFWLRMTTALTSGQVFNLITKGLAGYDPSLELQLIWGGTNLMRLVAKWGLTASTEYSYTHTGINLAHSTWYHIAVRIDGTASKILKMRIAVDGGSTYDVTGAPSDVLRLSSTHRRLVIGAKDSGNDALDGRIDELLFFNNLLSDAEVVNVKNGTFDFGDARLVSRFRFESGALTADSKGTAVLKVPGVDSDVSDYRYGSGCVNLTGNSNLRISEANLSALFPWKSTDTWKNGGVAAWFKFYSVNNGTLFAKHATASYLRGVRLYLGAANHLFYTAANSYAGQQEVDTGIVVVPGRWYFIGFSCDGRNVNNSYYWFTVYVYDSVTDTVTVFGPSRNVGYGGYFGTADWSIGSDGNGLNSLCAKIDQLAVFDEWLFTPELAALKCNNRKGYNDVLTDPGLQAYWDFEDIPGSLVDEKNSTTLQAIPAGGIPAVGTNGLWRKSWEKGASLARGVTGTGMNNYFSITDANLQAGFPFKNGDTTKLISVTFWIKPESRFPGPRYIFGKWYNPAGSTRSFALVLNENRLYFYYAKSGDSYTATLRNTAIDILPGEWYHVSCALDGVGKTLYIKVVKASDGSVQTDIANVFTPLAYAVNVTTVALYIGNQDYGSTAYPTRDWLNFHGLIDEVAVFAEKVDEAKMDSIRAGGYDYAGDAACKALWLFESGALTTDSKGTNTLTAAGTPVAGGRAGPRPHRTHGAGPAAAVPGPHLAAGCARARAPAGPAPLRRALGARDELQPRRGQPQHRDRRRSPSFRTSLGRSPGSSRRHSVVIAGFATGSTNCGCWEV